MIITEEQDVLELRTGGLLSKQDADGPPPYSPPSVLLTTSNTTPPDLRPSNFLLISHKVDVIKGRYLIDLAHRVPQALLPTESRANLGIKNFAGGIDAAIWLVNSEPEYATNGGVERRAVLDVNSTFGPVRISLNADSELTSFALNVHTSFGPIALSIPRSYRGPLMIQSSVAPIKLSPALAARFQTLENVNGKRRGFVGDWRASAEEGRAAEMQNGLAEWKGSTIEVGTTYGPIQISYTEDNSES